MIIELQELAVIDKNVMDIAKTGMSDPCEAGSIVVASETLAPSAPTFSIAAELSALVLTLTRPTTKTDETALNSFREFAIYHSTGSGIDISDDGTYDGIIYSSSTSVEHKCTVETFFRVTALNTFSVESLPSAEDSETPSGAAALSSDIPDDATDLVFDGNPIIGDGIIGLLILDPATTWGLFAHWEIQFALSTDSGSSWGAWTALTKTTKFGYLHKGISTAAGRRYKYRGRPVGEDGVGSTTWDESDNSGDGWPNAGTWGSDNSAVVAETVLAENIIALNEVRTVHLEADSVTGAKINADEIVAGHITTNAITTVKINGVAVTSAKLGALSAIYGKVAGNAVRTNELQVDGYIDMNSNQIWECAEVRNASVLTSHAMNLASGSDYWIGYESASVRSEIVLTSDAALRGYNDLTIDAQGGDLYLKAGSGSGDYIILELYGSSGHLQIQDWVGDGGGIGHEGYIKLYLQEAGGSWVTRYIHLEENN